MDAAAHAHGVDDERFLGKTGTDVVLLVIGHDVVGGNESRHIATGLAGQVVVDFPEVGFLGIAGAANGLVNIARTTVIGGDGKRPVAIDSVELLEIGSGLLAGAIGIATLINERIHLEAHATRRAQHELPQASSTRRRNGIGVHGRLDDRDVPEFERQPLFFECLLKDGHIVEAHAKHLLHKGAVALHITVNVGANHLVVRQLNGRRDGLEAADVLGLVDLAHRLVFDLLVEDGVVLEIPVLHHGLGVGLETGGKHDVVVGDCLFDGKNRLLVVGKERQRGKRHDDE